MCGALGTTAGLVLLLLCPLVMVTCMVAVAFLAGFRPMCGRGRSLADRQGSHQRHDEERPLTG